MRALLLLGVMISLNLSAQNENNTMRKFESQLPQQGRGNARVEYVGKSIDQMVYEFMEAEGIPGLTLAIVQAPYIPRVVGYGVTDIEYKKLATEKTLWPIGPIAQAFTAVAVMQLYESGKLNINKGISFYLNNLPQAWKSITVKQLMQHSSGIADYRNVKGFDASKDYSTADLLESVSSIPLPFESGTDVQVSATNFLLLAEIVEHVAKMPYRDFVKKNQIDYLGLKQIYFTADLDKVKQEDIVQTGGRHKTFTMDKDYINPSETSNGYTDGGNGKLIKVTRQSSSVFKGFSDMWASAENISHWDIALAGSVLIHKPENRDIVYKPTTLSNGKVVPAMAGWHFYAHRGLMDIKGNAPGHSAFLSRFTDTSELVCVTLLANKEGVDFTNLGRRIAAAFDNKKIGTGADDNLLYTYESQFSVEETVARIEQNLKLMGIPVFAKFDHAKNAKEVGMDLRPTQVIVFGAPNVGTNLMLENQSIAGELPLKISVWQDATGSVWVNFPQMKAMAAKYGMENNPIIAKMQAMLEQLVIKSSSVY